MFSMMRKGWFQVIMLGVLIGGALILLDSKFHWFEKDKPKKFYGPVSVGTDEVYFTKVEFEPRQFDFGKVKEGDTVTHVFKIKNTGKELLYIFKIAGSCDCISPAYSSRPIIPGDEADIIVNFKTKGRKGRQMRPLVITTNTEPAETSIKLIGEVE